MKTLTEFSIVMLRRGAEARAAKTAEGVAPEAMAEAIAGGVGIAAERAQRLLEALDVVGDKLDNVRLVRVYQGEKGPAGATSVGEFHYAVDRVVAANQGRRGGRDDRRGGDRDRGGERRGGPGGGGGGGGFGGGGFGDRRGPPKPRGLGSLKASAPGEKKEGDGDDGRPQRGEIPRAGVGWVLTAAPREARDDRGGRGRGPGRGPRRGRPGGGPGGGGPGGPGGDRDNRGPRGPRRGPGGPGGPGPQAEGAGGPGGPGGDRDNRGPRRGGRGRGPGGPGGPGGGGRGPGGPGGGRGPGGPRGPRPPMNAGGGEPVQAATDAPAPAPAADETPKS